MAGEISRLNGKKGGRPRKHARPADKPAKSKRARKPRQASAPPSPPPPPRVPRDHEPITSADKLTTLERQRLFLEEFARNGNVLRSCQRLGIARGTVYGEWVKQPEFKAAFEQAAEDATDLLEEEARRRAIEGVPEAVHYQGVRCDTIQKYSDSLLMFLLRGKREAFREKRTVGVGVESGGTGGLRKVIVEIDESPGAGA